MKRSTRIIVLAGLAAASMAFVSQDGSVLRLTLKENAVDTYKLESKTHQTINLPTGEQEMAINTSSTYKVTTKKIDADKGVADVEMETTVDKIDADGPMAEMVAGNKPKPFTLSGKLNTRGRLETDLSKLSAASMMMGGAQSGPNPVFVELPEKPVKIGDTWDVVVSKGLFTGPTDQKLTAKLVGEKTVDDREVWVISTTGTLNIDVDMSKLPQEAGEASPVGNDLKIHMKTEITAESLVEKGTGKTVRTEMKTKSKNSFDVAALGSTLDGTANTTLIATLQK